MGRKEDRKLKKLNGEKLKSNHNLEPTLAPITMGNVRYIPVHADNVKAPAMQEDSRAMSPEEFMNSTHELSDRELNRIIYQNAKIAIADGTMPDFPEDDYGTVMWFTWNFITPEMRAAFPAIAKEYLKHYRTDDAVPIEFANIPYPRVNESTWDDAYYFRVLLMMLFSARNGSACGIKLNDEERNGILEWTGQNFFGFLLMEVRDSLNSGGT